MTKQEQITDYQAKIEVLQKQLALEENTKLNNLYEKVKDAKYILSFDESRIQLSKINKVTLLTNYDYLVTDELTTTVDLVESGFNSYTYENSDGYIGVESDIHIISEEQYNEMFTMIETYQERFRSAMLQLINQLKDD